MEIDPDARAALEPELEPGEKLLWAGRPKRGLLLRQADYHRMPFQMFIGAFTLIGFFLFFVEEPGERIPSLILGAVMTVLGLYLLVGRIIHDALIRRWMFYGISSRRVLFMSLFLRRSVTALELCEISDVRVKHWANGIGTVCFGFTRVLLREGWSGFLPPSLFEAPIFDHVDGVAGIERVLCDAYAQSYARAR